MRRDYDSYTLFCNEILSCLVGRYHWNQLAWQQPVSQMTTASDEAFAHLIVENSWEVWKELALDPDPHGCESSTHGESSLSTNSSPLWTGNSLAAKKYGGWNEAGKRCFNELFNLVVADRNRTLDFELQYLQAKKLRNLRKKGKDPRLMVQAMTFLQLLFAVMKLMMSRIMKFNLVRITKLIFSASFY